MARIQYGPDNAPVELIKVRVLDLSMEPDTDPSGTDYLYTKISMTVSFQWQPNATASNNANAAGAPFDSVGVSVRSLRQTLNMPRQTFRFYVGNDLVWNAPAIDPATGLRLPCDPNLGPAPKLLSLSEIEGDNLATGRMKITFWVLGCSNLLLSNRWTVSVDITDTGMTRRTVQGWATLRADAIRPGAGAAGVFNNVDDFRIWMFCPCPSGFYRERVKVKINETGTVSNYTVLDSEDPNPMGLDGSRVGAVKFEGEFTAGSHSVVKDYATFVQTIAARAVDVALGQPGGPLNKIIEAQLLSILPTAVATGWVKVTGGKTALKLNLMSIAAQILQDRAGANATVVSAMGTQGVGKSEKEGRWAKCAMVFLPDMDTFVGNAFNPLLFRAFARYDNDITVVPGVPIQQPQLPTVTFPGGVAPDETSPQYKNYNLPNGQVIGDPSGTRGSWRGALIAQALQTQCSPPAAPPANITVAKQRLLV